MCVQAPNIYEATKQRNVLYPDFLCSHRCVSSFVRLCSIVMYLFLAGGANQRLIVFNICNFFKEADMTGRLKIAMVVCIGNISWMEYLISSLLSISLYLSFYRL